ncbi:aspartate aminotransferase family protein [Curtobacterium pusillum]|uniref:Aspartate aminotransferase family protein n=1 Tax=Curtobacterium pusillum TaxID=69373 RepID=A0ABX2MHL2_9MICO|nr:aspartate aminotransferase family protein [Curtobacterium pusillum]NUU14976.1 aspartate aminotransferase family protein [Curtobacterium pusillum]
MHRPTVDVPALSESDTNRSERRRRWDADRSRTDRTLLDRDAAVFLKQSVSTPCLTSIVSAEGSWLVGTDGTRYLDLHGNSAHQIGYGHPRLVAALREQLAALPFVPRRFTSEVSAEFAEALVQHAPDGLDRVLLTTGGSDAIELALKIARVATGRHKTLSFWDSFHGAGFGASSVGGEQLFRSGPLSPLLPGAEHVPPFGCHGDHFGPGHRADEPHVPSCGVALARLVDYTLRVQGDVAAVVAEPMRAVPTPAPPGFWQAVRASCDATGTLLVFDEIPTGLGRTGAFSASEHEGVVPDLLVWGKGLGGAAVPVAAVLARAELDVAGDWALGHYTHEKNPLMARAGLTTMAIIDDEQLVERARAAGAAFEEGLRSIGRDHDVVADVRGRGLFLGMELHDADTAEAVLYACMRRGLSFKTTMGKVLTLAPPLTVTDDELTFALETLAVAFREATG